MPDSSPATGPDVSTLAASCLTTAQSAHDHRSTGAVDEPGVRRDDGLSCLREKSRIALVLPPLWRAATCLARSAASGAGDPAVRPLEMVAAVGDRDRDAGLRRAARARRALVRPGDAGAQHLGGRDPGRVLLLPRPAPGPLRTGADQGGACRLRVGRGRRDLARAHPRAHYRLRALRRD